MWPLLATIGGSAITGIASSVGSLAGKATNAVIDPLTLYVKHAANFIAQSNLPEVSTGVHAFLQGGLSLDALNGVFAVNNYHVGDDGINVVQKFNNRIIQHYIKSIVPKLDLNALLYAWYSGIIDNDTFSRLSGNFKVLGGSWDAMSEIAYSKFNESIIINNYNRDSFNDVEALARTRKLYGCSEKHASQIIRNSKATPTMAQIMSFASKGIYDDTVVNKLKMDDEYDKLNKGIKWAEAQGFYEDVSIGPDGNLNTRNIVKDAWRDHWSTMTTAQAYVAVRKLRPDRIGRYLDSVPAIKTFTGDDLTQVLQANAILPGHRDWIDGLTFNGMQLRHLRGVHGAGIIDDKELYEQFIDMGYLVPDAQNMTKWYMQQKKDKDKKDKESQDRKDFAKKINAVYAAYETGSIGREVAYNSLVTMDSETARVLANLDAIDILINNKRVTYLIGMVKSEFFLGLYTGLQAYVELTQGGINDIRANQYVILWQRQLSRPRKLASISTVLDWYKRILITFDDAAARLANLGVSNEETLLYLEQSQQDINKQMATQQAKNSATLRQAAAASQKAQAAMIAKHNADKAELRSYSGIGQMKIMFKQGIMDEATVVDRMQFLDIPIEDILRYITLWKEENQHGKTT
jgi:hypothetical protein